MGVYEWDTFSRYHGGTVGSRDCFERLMEDLLRKIYPEQNVQIVREKIRIGVSGGNQLKMIV